MAYQSAIFADAEHKTISATLDGVALLIPVDEENRNYKELIEEGTPIADYAEPPKPFLDVPAAAFWAVADELLSMTRPDALALAANMPESTIAERLKKKTVVNVINGDGKMHHDNPTMKGLVAAKGLTQEQFDNAWRVAEKIEW